MEFNLYMTIGAIVFVVMVGVRLLEKLIWHSTNPGRYVLKEVCDERIQLLCKKMEDLIRRLERLEKVLLERYKDG